MKISPFALREGVNIGVLTVTFSKLSAKKCKKIRDQWLVDRPNIREINFGNYDDATDESESELIDSRASTPIVTKPPIPPRKSSLQSSVSSKSEDSEAEKGATDQPEKSAAEKSTPEIPAAEKSVPENLVLKKSTAEEPTANKAEKWSSSESSEYETDSQTSGQSESEVEKVEKVDPVKQAAATIPKKNVSPRSKFPL